MELIENLKNVWVIPLEVDGFVWASLAWIVNCIFWLLDLYPLVKKKSIRETMAVMLLPGFIFVAIALLASLLLGITTGAPLEDGFPFMEKRVCAELLVLASAFLAVWLLAMRLRGSRNDTWKKRLFWALSYVPDLIIVVCILTVSLARLIWGTYLLPKLWSLSTALGFTSYNIFAWLYVYGIVTLLIRLALLLVAIADRLISMRIPVGAYRENGHSVRRFIWYAAICQNAYMRGVLAFYVPAIVFFVVLLFRDRPDSLSGMAMVVGFFSFIGVATFMAVLITLKPTVENLRRFSKWGDRKALTEQFCREYFNETPVFSNSDYTVTRHFLVDKRSTINVYYLEMLKDWSCCQRVSMTAHEQKNNTYWSQPHTVDQAQRSGWQWEISFLGGDICAIEREDASADAVLKSLSSYRDSHQLEELSTLQSGIMQYNSQGDGFDKLFRFGVWAIGLLWIVMLLISGSYMADSNGAKQQINFTDNEDDKFLEADTSMSPDPEEPESGQRQWKVYIQPDMPEPLMEVIKQFEDFFYAFVQDQSFENVWEKVDLTDSEWGYMFEELCGGWHSKLMYAGEEKAEEYLRCSLTDLTGDGFPELIMGYYLADYDRTYPKAVFYYNETEGIKMRYVTTYYNMELYEGGIIEYISGGVDYTVDYAQFQEDIKEWLGIDSFLVETVIDGEDVPGGANYYRREDGGDFVYDYVEYEQISEEEYKRITGSYTQKPVEMEWTPLIFSSVSDAN